MLDIRLIREKPDFVRERLAARGDRDEARIDDALRIDAERRLLAWRPPSTTEASGM